MAGGREDRFVVLLGILFCIVGVVTQDEALCGFGLILILAS